MQRWWLRPLVRTAAAVLLPIAVPLILTLLLWALPGDPASIICPPETCTGGEALAQKWNLDSGPMHYFTTWVAAAVDGDFGNSWRVATGVEVRGMVVESIPNTIELLLFAMVPVLLGTTLAALDAISEKADPVLQVLGLIPAIVLALVAAAWKTLTYGEMAPGLVGVLLGAAVLGLSDGALSGAIIGTRSLFSAESRQRYVGVGVLRGERIIENTLPNVLPALAGQIRARVLQLLSAAVVVEVILRINGLGDLLWRAALLQDFGLVLPVATCFALISSVLLLLQALVEMAVALHVRRSPSGVFAAEAA